MIVSDYNPASLPAWQRDQMSDGIDQIHASDSGLGLSLPGD
jgi:hypothetical protein